MLKRQSRHLALLLVLTMLATLFVGVGVAQAKTVNSVNKVISVVDGETYNLNELTIKADTDFVEDFKANETFEVVLPDGVKWHKFDTNVEPITGAVATKISDTVAEFKITSAGVTAGKVVIPLSFEIDGASGTLAVKVDPLDSAVTGGSYNFAIVAEGDLTASVDSVKKIARNSSTKAGTIQLRESSVGAVAYGEVKVVVKLPSNFSWIMDGTEKTSVNFSGGFSGLSTTKFSADGRELTIKFNAPKNRDQRGTLYITPFINPNRSASYGEVEVGIKADDKNGSVFDGDLVIAEYVDWGIKAKVKDVEELIAGKFDQKTAKITIEESVANTLLANRDLTVELPEWVKITKFNRDSVSGIEIGTPDVDGEDNYVDIPITKSTISSTGKIEFKLNLSIEGNKSGDIEAKIFGAGAEETSLVIAKAAAPVVPTIEKVNEVKIGIQSQPVADLTIVEGKKNGVRCDVKKAPEVDLNKKGQMVLSLTEGARFAKTPKVTVTDGNLEIIQENVRLDSNEEKVVIPIKSEGTKLSTVKVSDIMITLSRAVPEGDLKIKVGGNAVIENSRPAGNDAEAIEAGEFTTGSIPVVAAKVITPADTNIHAVATYVIGNTIYQINGVDQAAMDQAPYIKNDRTFLPIRFVAYGLGIGDNGIIWDQVSQTVTLMKNDKVVQLKIGSTTMLVNGVAITMDAAPEITAANRTCLPIRFVAEAFGAVVGWDAATQTVTVTL
ncbi:MAG: copper amine oxidase N-terminal domain-containing protein [Syntrophomonadaceae bacterium]|jgi:hypothetical protein